MKRLPSPNMDARGEIITSPKRYPQYNSKARKALKFV